MSRVLLVTDEACLLTDWGGGRLLGQRAFGLDASGRAAMLEHLEPDAPALTLLVDSVHDNYRLESQPASRLRDRRGLARGLLRRHLADAPLSAAHRMRQPPEPGRELWMLSGLTTESPAVGLLDDLADAAIPVGRVLPLPRLAAGWAPGRSGGWRLLVSNQARDRLRLSLYRDSELWFSRLALIGRTTGQPFAEIDGIVRETLDHLAALPLRSPPSEFPIILLAAPGEGARLVSATWGPLGPRLRLIETALPDRPTPTPTPTPTPDFGIGAWVFSALACDEPGRGIGYSHRASAAIARRRAYTRHLPGVAASLALAAAAWAVDATLHRQASSLHAASLAAAVAARQPALESWLRRADQGTRRLGRTQAMLAADAALLRWADRSAPGLPARVAQVLARHPAIELDRFGWREPGAPAESPADSPAASLSGRVRAESGGPRQARRMFEEFIADLGRSMVPLEVEPATRPFTWPSARNGPGAGWNDPGFAVYLGPR